MFSFLWGWNFPHSTLQGSSLSQKLNNSNIGSGSHWKGPNSLVPNCWESHSGEKSCKEDSNQTSWQEEAEASRAPWKRVRTMGVTWKGHSPACWAACRLVSVLQVPRFRELSPILSGLWWCKHLLVISAPVSNSPILLLSNPNKTHWHPKWCLYFGLSWAPYLGWIDVCVVPPQGKSCQTTLLLVLPFREAGSPPCSEYIVLGCVCVCLVSLCVYA